MVAPAGFERLVDFQVYNGGLSVAIQLSFLGK
jgi:hypothetical protein